MSLLCRFHGHFQLSLLWKSHLPFLIPDRLPSWALLRGIVISLHYLMYPLISLLPTSILVLPTDSHMCTTLVLLLCHRTLVFADSRLFMVSPFAKFSTMLTLIGIFSLYLSQDRAILLAITPWTHSTCVRTSMTHKHQRQCHRWSRCSVIPAKPR